MSTKITAQKKKTEWMAGLLTPHNKEQTINVGGNISQFKIR